MKTRQARTTVFRGKEVPLKEVANELGLSYQVVWRRVTAFNETGDDIESGTRRGSDFASMADSDLVAWMVEDQRKLIAAQERHKHSPLALSTTPEHRAKVDCAYAELLRRDLVPEVNRHFAEFKVSTPLRYSTKCAIMV